MGADDRDIGRMRGWCHTETQQFTEGARRSSERRQSNFKSLSGALRIGDPIADAVRTAVNFFRYANDVILFGERSDMAV